MLTHWPGLRAPSVGIERTDILIHLAVFGLWAVLLLGTAYAGVAATWRSIGRGWAIAVVYAAADEVTQALPGVNRVAAWDDYGANVLGITLACAVWGATIRRALARPVQPNRERSGS